MRFSVRVPASSANLGPGFDSMALALARYLTVEVEAGSGQSRNEQHADLTDGRDMVMQALALLSEHTERELPQCSVQTRSEIPVARGMGSSAAALIGGLLAANELLDRPLEREQLLSLAIEVEGHADNLAAALYGGMRLAVPVESEQYTYSMNVRAEIVASVMIPQRIGFTADARAVVPDRLTRRDAVFNASRCALMVHALESGEPELLSVAMQDSWHQPYRSSLYPYLDEVIGAAVRAGAYGASLSGSGPSILALSDRQSANGVARAMREAAGRQEIDCVADVVEIDFAGAQVRSV